MLHPAFSGRERSILRLGMDRFSLRSDCGCRLQLPVMVMGKGYGGTPAVGSLSRVWLFSNETFDRAKVSQIERA